MLKNRKTPRRVTLDILECILEGRKCLYLSTPMTNGPRLIALHKSKNLTTDPNDYNELFQEHVFGPNCLDSKSVADRLRKKTGQIVINPACFDISGWSQEDYLLLWCRTIRRFAKEVWFNEGWFYSNGCTQEFLVAQQSGIPTIDLAGTAIRLVDAIHAISAAIPELQEVAISTNSLETTVKDLSQLL